MGVRRPGHRWPVGQPGWFELGGARAIQVEMDVARGGAIRNQGDRQVGGMRRVIQNFHVEHGGEATQPLRANAQRIDFFVNFQPQGFNARELRATGGAGFQFMDIAWRHDGFLGQQHGFFRRAANADAEDAGRAPACAHAGHGFEYPVDQVVRRVQHGEFGFCFRAAAFGRADDFDMVARHDFKMHHSGGVVLGIFTRAGGVGKHRGT